jgi:hypothetical protein
MKLEPQRIVEFRTFLFNGVEGQKAQIIFQFINDTGLKNDGRWDFMQCRFNTVKPLYTLDDWEFLEALNQKIREINKKLNKV